jgi:hypothetical protein
LICDNIGVKWDKELGKFGGFGEGCYLMYSLPIWAKVFLWFISLFSKFNLALASAYLSLELAMYPSFYRFKIFLVLIEFPAHFPGINILLNFTIAKLRGVYCI